jgi:hypothetical protein
VHALIDNGADSGSGIAPMKKARAFAKAHHIHYMAIGDNSIHKDGNTLALIEGDGAPKILGSAREFVETANWRRLERFALPWDGWPQNSGSAWST